MKKTIVTILILITFLTASILMINIPKKALLSEYRATDLKSVETIYGNTTRTDYLDSEGNLCVAANLGYATKIVTKEEKKELEIYLDDRGERVSRSAGYFGILREYDEDGNNIRITYLDTNNKPVTISEGFSIAKMTYNEEKQIVASKYFDPFGRPVETYYYGYGILNEYDENGRIFRITYLDQYGKPMVTDAGYAIIEREFYLTDGAEKGKVKKEFYFDSDSKAVALSLGQYGIYKEYDENGQTSLVTYLDAYGNPIVTNKGFTTLVYTYHADNSTETVMYYDIDGKPFRMSEGQYGAKSEDGQTVYLNADGKEQFNIKNFVYNDSRFVISIAICIVILSSMIGKKLNWLLLIVYLGAIVYFTLMYRETKGAEIGILNSYLRFIISAEARTDILRNIWLFIPLGAILFQICPHKTVLFIPILLSITIEVTQYFMGTGLCELDDVISNGVGGAIGYGLSSIIQSYKEKLKGNDQEKV